MKRINQITIALFSVATLFFTSCYDEKMEWGDPYNHPAASELPLQLQEQISRYEALNAYTTFKLGVGIDFNLYTTDENYRRLINENFDEIAAGNEMKQSSLMNTKGELNFDKADAAIEQLRAAGLTIYGHTLIWQNQQQASYWNSLIAPTVVPGQPGESLVDGSFENGMQGWAATYYAENYTITTDEFVDGTHSLKVVIPSDATGGKYDGHGQLNSPDFAITSGHHYQISFWIKSSVPGQVTIDFPNGHLGNQYPWVNGAEYAPVGTTWTQVVYNTTTVGGTAMIATEDNAAMRVRLLLASVPNVTYHIDGIEITDLDAAPAEVNLLTNGSFESGLPDWTVAYYIENYTITTEETVDGAHSLKVIIPSDATGGKYDGHGQLSSPNFSILSGHSYQFSFWIKGTAPGQVAIDFPNGRLGNQYPWVNGAEYATVGTTWTQVIYNTTTVGGTAMIATEDDAAMRVRLLLASVPNVTYYIDDVKLIDITASIAPAAKNFKLKSGPVTIQKTPEEKFAILEPLYKQYITDVATHFKGKVAAWDVVNEPMNENGTLRTGEEDLNSTNLFYWQYYLGKDYAVTAFKVAREADPDAKLFINDFNLESQSGSKLDGFLSYIEYIESQGATIDGIGTQMHMNINWIDTTSIKRMFQKLATTGKLIKVSELDIAVSNETEPASPVAPTAEQYARQAELYRVVADYYTKYIPEAQRYGITVWGVSDNEKEHQFWLKNDAPCIWNANYERKHAYKGFANGLAGRDVSAEFSGELIY